MPFPTEAYGAFAYAYDQALGATFFQAVRRMLDDVVERYPSAGRTHLDLACGTGYALEYFRQRGFRSTGLDASMPMLSVARQRSPRLIAGDFRTLPLRRPFARITCLYDSLNHMLTEDDLTSVFTSVSGVMSPESLFLFDMNHPDIYPAVWGMREPFVSTGPDHHLEIATKYRALDHRAFGRVTGWARFAGGARVPIRENHEQRAWREKEIHGCLAAGGLAAAEVLEFDPFQEIETVDAEGVKMFFVVEKRGNERWNLSNEC